jgi:hypothetical protein
LSVLLVRRRRCAPRLVRRPSTLPVVEFRSVVVTGPFGRLVSIRERHVPARGVGRGTWWLW